MTNINKSIITVLAAFLFTGCGGSDSTGASDNNSGNQDGSQAGQETPIEENEQNLNFSASFSDRSGILGSGRLLNYNNETKSLELTAPFPIAALIPEASGVLPKHPEISFITNPDEKTITLSVPITNYIDLIDSPTTLPDGRPLPGVNGGEAPSFGFPLDFLKSEAYGYAAFDSFSIFVESGLNLPINLAVPINSDQDGKQVGKVHWLAPSNGNKGGIFISVTLPKALSVILANAQ